MEQRPELRYALHVSPTAVSVAAERTRCMRCFHFTQLQDESHPSESFTETTSLPGRLFRLLPVPSLQRPRLGREENEIYSKL